VRLRAQQGGLDNGVFWESNGPLYVRDAIDTVEREFRETLALCYLLERLGWPAYVPGPGPRALLVGSHEGWPQYAEVLRSETGLARARVGKSASSRGRR
jgi:hypothetical protein